MTYATNLTPEIWLTHLFSSRAARDGAVIRRKLRDIDRFFGLDEFETELRRRGYHAVINAGQMIIFCNREPVEVIC